MCQSLFFNKVVGFMPASLLKKRHRHSYFPMNFAKFLRTPFLQNTSGQLLLHIVLILTAASVPESLFTFFHRTPLVATSKDCLIKQRNTVKNIHIFKYLNKFKVSSFECRLQTQKGCQRIRLRTLSYHKTQNFMEIKQIQDLDKYLIQTLIHYGLFYLKTYEIKQ